MLFREQIGCIFNACLLLLLLAPHTHADLPEIEDCIVNMVIGADEDRPASEIRKKCLNRNNETELPPRIVSELATQENAFVITPHRQNYILPYTYVREPNQSPWLSQDVYPGIDEPIENPEAKLQLSFKVPLTNKDLITKNDHIYFGFTMKSFWQVYNDDLSAPFRDTNYRPEIFYQAPIPSEWLGGTWFTRVGLEHESNGRSQRLSRSWNRAYVALGFIGSKWAIYLQPWYRLPENAKIDDGDPNTPPPPKGDDNPDIQKYMGHYELTAAYKYENWEFSSLARFNFKEGKGAIELGTSFPLWGRVKGFVQYFNGYGDALIDYDSHTHRLGIGVLLTDLL